MTPHQHLEYDPLAGTLRWKPRPLTDFATPGYGKRWNKLFAGKQAGCVHEGKWQLRFQHETYQCARLAWELHHGETVPDEMVVTYTNEDRLDLRAENLTLVTRSDRSVDLAKRYCHPRPSIAET